MTFNPGDMVQEDIPFKCPFCGRDCATVKGDVPGVLHAMPPCRAFGDLDPVDFLRAVNRAKALRN